MILTWIVLSSTPDLSHLAACENTALCSSLLLPMLLCLSSPPCGSSVAFGPGNTIMPGVREFAQPNSAACRRYMSAYFQRFTTLMVNQVWCCSGALQLLIWLGKVIQKSPYLLLIELPSDLSCLFSCRTFVHLFLFTITAPAPVCQKYLLPFPQCGCFQFSYISNYTAQLPLICFLLAWKSELWSI